MDAFNNKNGNIGWDERLSPPGGIDICLKEGDYNFVVIQFERGLYNGGKVVPQCNKAVLTMEIEAPARKVTIKNNLFLCHSFSEKIYNFFCAIGHTKRGDYCDMDWGNLVGAKGRAHFKPHTDSKGKTWIDIDRFYDYDPAFFENDIVEPSDELPF